MCDRFVESFDWLEARELRTQRDSQRTRGSLQARINCIQMRGHGKFLRDIYR